MKHYSINHSRIIVIIIPLLDLLIRQKEKSIKQPLFTVHSNRQTVLFSFSSLPRYWQKHPHFIHFSFLFFTLFSLCLSIIKFWAYSRQKQLFHSLWLKLACCFATYFIVPQDWIEAAFDNPHNFTYKSERERERKLHHMQSTFTCKAKICLTNKKGIKPSSYQWRRH